MAESLVELKNLVVSDCTILEEIVSTRCEANAASIDVVFRKLEILPLCQLQNLTRFCSKSRIELSPVKKFNTDVGGYIFGSTSGTAVLTSFFDSQIKFPSLERLEISHMGKLQTLRDNNQLADQVSFDNLREVNVGYCDSLISVFVTRMMGRLNALETLEIINCKSLEVVFEDGKIDAEDHLKPVYCQNLCSVKICRCSSLRDIFSASVDRGLQKLHSLIVEDCDEVEGIICGEQELETQPHPLFNFPKVTSVEFSNMVVPEKIGCEQMW